VARILGYEDDGEPGGLYAKYRVFREPQFDDARNPIEIHPVPLECGPVYGTPADKDSDLTIISAMEEITDFVFVLKPENDPHARVAIAAYAWSVKGEDPSLWGDLMNVLAEWMDD